MSVIGLTMLVRTWLGVGVGVGIGVGVGAGAGLGDRHRLHRQGSRWSRDLSLAHARLVPIVETKPDMTGRCGPRKRLIGRATGGAWGGMRRDLALNESQLTEA